MLTLAGVVPPTIKAIDPSFEREAVSAISGVRNTFARIIEQKCRGSAPVSALCEAFGIHRKLAWQVSKVAYTSDAFAAARHMPTAKSVGAWLDAARTAGIQPELIEAARVAALKFESLAEAHAASREELEMLLESCGAASDVGAAEKWREQSFRGNSFVWGAHCRVLLAMIVLAPSEDRAESFHVAQVRGLIGYRQTRAGVRWLVNQSVVADDSAQTATGIVRVALDPESARKHGGVPVLAEFCSEPIAGLERRATPDGVVHDEFLPGPVGQAGERTLVTGEVMRNIGSPYATENDKVAHFGTSVRIPAQLLHLDMFVHRGLFGPVERELRCFNDLAAPIAFADSDMLPVAERITPMGRGVAMAHTPDIPAYADLASSVFARMRIDADEYELYRVRMAFPPMPTSVMFRHELPARPGSTQVSG